MSSDKNSYGVISSVVGGVVEARFPDQLPPINNLLVTGKDDSILVEVALHLNANTVRGNALTPTQGLTLGSPVRDQGCTLEAPAGP